MTIELKNRALRDIALVSFEVIRALECGLCPYSVQLRSGPGGIGMGYGMNRDVLLYRPRYSGEYNVINT